ncbi:hypothetical protein [Aquibacillus sediminis]|uniref:hypothetical protein n=1 Tax=Aquibacillus sediminis TaxID=2574734 RepID=UPI001107BA35|nr:hypothetical protein [Aquibacillus sediminis]
MYVVSRCFNWIGYHLVDQLLQQGQEVIGIDDIKTPKQEHFALLIGRNSLFTHQETVEEARKEGEIDTLFTINDHERAESLSDLKTSKWIHLSNQAIRDGDHIINVHLPLLYGEWMPRDAEGCYVQQQYIRFDSDTFKHQAIYIQDFVQALIQLVKSEQLPKTVDMYPLKRLERAQTKQENHLFIRELAPLEKRHQDLLTHYQKFQQIYLTLR